MATTASVDIGFHFDSARKTAAHCIVKVVQNTKKGQVDKLALENFKAGSSFENAMDLYVFDKRLRLIVMDALERIEIAQRVDISHTLGKHGASAYLDPTLFQDDFSAKLDKNTGISKHHTWLQNHARVTNRSREGFIQHNKNKYGLPLAIWIACEVWDFGILSTLFSGMKPEEQNQIAQKYGITKGHVFSSWLRCLSYLRNICAHHSRLWNRNIVDQPKMPSVGDVLLFDSGWQSTHVTARPFLLLCITQHLLCTINPHSTWWQRVSDHLGNFPDVSHLDLNLDGMGIMDGWDTWSWTE